MNAAIKFRAQRQRWFLKYPRLALFITVIVCSLLLLLCFEGFLYLFLRFPVLSAYFPYCKPVAVYFNYDRNILQLTPGCAMYDPELTYILKPGEFDFCNREYCNHYRVNSIGARDNEASLHQPEIIVLGDSYAAGWGVNQDETFANRIENNTGLKTLNAGIPSYGTAREMMLLNRLDVSCLKYLVIQYCNNDFEENQRYINNNFALNLLSKQEYEAECNSYMNRKRYTFLSFTSSFLEVVKGFLKRHLKTFFPAAQASLAASRFSPIDYRMDDAATFLQLIGRSDLHNIAIIVLNLSHYTMDTRSFIQKLAVLKQQSKYPEMKLIDTASFLEKSDYFIIDDHLNAAGHDKVAAAITQAINESN